MDDLRSLVLALYIPTLTILIRKIEVDRPEVHTIDQPRNVIL